MQRSMHYPSSSDGVVWMRFWLLFVAGGMLCLLLLPSQSPSQHHKQPQHSAINKAAYNEAMMNATGMRCASNHCSYSLYGEPVPVAGSQACVTYHGQRHCVTWKALKCSEPKGVICPPGQVYPTPSTLLLANGQIVHELSWNVPAYYLVGKSGSLRTLHAIDNYANYGVVACTAGNLAWQQANQYTQLPNGTKVQFC